MSGAAATAAPRGLLARVAAAWGGFRASTAREAAEGHGEPRLLAYAIGGCFVLWLARAPEVLAADLARAAATGTAATPPAMLLTTHLVSMLFFTPLMLYGVAALMRMILRAFGGTGGWRETRLAVFWSLVVAAPAFLVAGAAGSLLRLGGAPEAAPAAMTAAGLIWLWFWSAGLAEVHGFRRGWPIFAVVAGLAAALEFAPTGVMSG